jgi:hypothetical protein
MTDTFLPTDCVAFSNGQRLATGSQLEVALAVKAALDADSAQQVLVFDALTSRPIDFDLRGDAAAISARLMAVARTVEPRAPAEPEPGPLRPGRPKLGVVAREVTLLPRHWDWLASQPGGASVTLRKLVETARRQQAGADDRRAGQEAAYRFMSAMAGNDVGFEEATRSLFANDRSGFERLIAAWPADLRQHLLGLAKRAFTSDQV